MMEFFTAKPKINVYLKVTAKRPDSYHELESLFLVMDEPCDKLAITAKDNGSSSLEISGLELPADADNLCLKALNEYCRNAKITGTFHIRLEKNIPLAAGLGGGSSDAGGVLNFLQSRYHCFNNSELQQLAASIGADVPFFLQSRPAIARGIGEKLEFVDLSGADFYIVLLNPTFPLSTLWSYRKLAAEHIGPSQPGTLETLINALRSNDFEQIGQLLHNDLAFAAHEKFPLLTLIRKFMLENGASAAGMSGSGPTMFALCKDAETSVDLEKKLKISFSSSGIWQNHIKY